MKKILFILCALVAFAGYSQAPEKMSYQAVIRGTDDGLIANQSIGMQLSILEGSPNGAAVYVETQTPTTNANGLATLEIGTGSIQLGDFTTIDWANGTYYLKTETDVTGGNNYEISGTSQLLSSPYALYAKTSGSSIPGPQGDAGEDGNGIESTVDNGDGTLTLNYTDGSSFTTIDLTGPEGPQGPAGDGTVLIDTDGDTQIQVEESPDEDIIRFDLAGTEKWVMKNNALEQLNSGESLFIGQDAGANDDLSSNKNVFLGFESGFTNSTGEFNSSIGYQSLYNNTLGFGNSANGYQSLFSNTIGSNNVADGYFSLIFNTTGNFNTAIGYKSLFKNNTANENTAIGANSLMNNETGNGNVAVGYQALKSNTIAEGNTAVGANALVSNTEGVNNIAVGFNTLSSNLTGNNIIAIGNNALYNNLTSANIGIGNQALENNTMGMFNIAIGARPLNKNNDGNRNIAIGIDALYSNEEGNDNIAIGYRTLEDNNTGGENIAIGNEVLHFNVVDIRNVGIGHHALRSTEGSWNTAIGYAALSTTTVSNSTAIGYNTGATSSNEVRLGNSSISSIGGFANWTNISDGRFKTNVEENVVGLDFILKLRPVTYNLDLDIIARFNKADESLRLKDAERLKEAELQSGFIAQEVEIAANMVGYDFHGIDKPKNENSHYGLRYAEFVVPLVKAVQEQQEEIELLKVKASQVNDLQNQINELKILIKNK